MRTLAANAFENGRQLATADDGIDVRTLNGYQDLMTQKSMGISIWSSQ